MKKQIIRLTENDLHKIVENSINKILKEGYYNDDDENDEWGGNFHDPNETHFAVNKESNLIVFGWNYSDEDKEDLRLFKNDYFTNDLVNMDFNPKEYRILTKRTLIRRGINPDVITNWSDDGITPCKGKK